MDINKNNKSNDLNDNDTGIYDNFFYHLEKDYKITLEQFKEYDFKKCGKLKSNHENGTHRYNKYFTNYFTDEEIIQLSSRLTEIKNQRRCICQVKISLKLLLYSKSQNILLGIGSCCNENFNPNGNKTFCSLCSKEHQNKNDNVCNECRERNFFKKCKKCGSKKTYDKYAWCIPCMNSNTNKKMFTECSACHQPKNEDTFTRCFKCNMELKNLKKNI